jgi:hypothetical protein
MTSTRNPATIPERDRVHCVQCGEIVDARAPGVAQRVVGWRINRQQGGANMVALAEPMPVWLCRFCLADRRAGRSWDQLSLFDDEPR